jgi:hypothetical protein
MAGQATAVVGGVDTHKHTLRQGLSGKHGQLLSDREFSTYARGQGELYCVAARPWRGCRG